MGVKKIKPWFALFLIILSSFWAGKQRLDLINTNTLGKEDPKNYANILKTIDWAYTNTNSTGFKAYNYVPEIYDYPYVYGYWKHGLQKYGYLPTEVSYGPEQPTYVRLNDKFLDKQKVLSGDKVVLTYEKKLSYKNWLNQSPDYCTVLSQDFEWNVKIEVREKCK